MAFQNRAFNPNVEEIYENCTTSKTDCKNVEKQTEGNVTQNENDSVLTNDHVYMHLYKPREIEIVARAQGSRNGPSLPPSQAQLPRAQLDEPNAEEQRYSGVNKHERRLQIRNQPRNNNLNVNEEPKYFTRRRLIYLVVILFSILVVVLLFVTLQNVGVIGYRHNREVQSQSSQAKNSSLSMTETTAKPKETSTFTDAKKVTSPSTVEWKRCTDPGIPSNGYRLGSKFYAGESVSYFCKQGYTLVGPVTILCQLNGQWTENKPSCKRSCAEPEFVLGAIRTGNRLWEGENVMYHCLKDSYHIKGNRVLTCLTDGNWSSPVPSCQYVGYFENTAILSDRLDYENLLHHWLKLVSHLKQWRRCWHGMTDGFAVSAFHSRCDNKGPTVTIVRVGSYIFGGYTDQSWGGSCGYKTSSKSFIFTLYNTQGYKPQKLHFTSSSNHYYQYGIYACSSYGPTFGGGHDLYISNNANTNTGSYTYSGHTYQAPHGCSQRSCSVLAGSYSSWTVSDIEVFYETS